MIWKSHFIQPRVSWWRLNRFLPRLCWGAAEPCSEVLIREHWCPSTSAFVPIAPGAAAPCLIISKQQAASSDPHMRHWPPGEPVQEDWGPDAESSQNTTDPLLSGGNKSLGRSSVKYAQAIQRLCIIERSKWEQDDFHASLIVNVFTVSGKTEVWAKGGWRVKCKTKHFLWLSISFLLSVLLGC